MASTTANKPLTENDMPEVFARTPEAVPHETCDECGQSVAARYEANKNGMSLFFCAHHIRKFADKLKVQGFAITPENIDFSFAG
jgi:hypothetical protein